MQDPRSWSRLLIITCVALTLVVLPSCRRAPEEPVGNPPAGAGDKTEPAIAALDLPLENPQIKVSLTAVPPGLVATYNGDSAIEVADENRPDLRYTFDADLPGAPSRSPKTVYDFEQFIGKHNDGRVTDNGEIETALGSATWASGTYFEEDQTFGDVRVFAPHPSGNGTLILSAVCPAGEATVEERLATMQKLLTNVS